MPLKATLRFTHADSRSTLRPSPAGMNDSAMRSMNDALPRMMRVHQRFPETPPLDIRNVLAAEFEKVRPRIVPGSSVAVGVGSRGITGLSEIVGGMLDLLKRAGAHPFIVPAMGSHGGATSEGQRALLADYGITEASMAVPIRSSMAVREIGTAKGQPVYCSEDALGADGILLINRVKPHTDFGGRLGSGIIKMSVIGLGKHAGAAAMHRAASRAGYEPTLRAMARVILDNTPVLGGVAILENQRHDTARIAILPKESIEEGEDLLQVQARDWMPKLPFDEIDLLIIDRFGKNISGAGMDPNVIGRGVHGYSSELMRVGQASPFIRRLFARDLTPETHGNAIGIGLADLTTSRVVRGMDARATYVNALTALTPQGAKIPIHFETDREAIQQALASLALADPRTARVVRIQDTLSLETLEISESLAGDVSNRPELSTSEPARAMEFNDDGNLLPLFQPNG